MAFFSRGDLLPLFELKFASVLSDMALCFPFVYGFPPSVSSVRVAPKDNPFDCQELGLKYPTRTQGQTCAAGSAFLYIHRSRR